MSAIGQAALDSCRQDIFQAAMDPTHWREALQKMSDVANAKGSFLMRAPDIFNVAIASPGVDRAINIYISQQRRYQAIQLFLQTDHSKCEQTKETDTPLCREGEL